jgi:hypothetical protein
MLSGAALDVAFALRDCVGPLQQGVDVPMADLRAQAGLADGEVVAAIRELESVGFVAVDPGDASSAGRGAIAAVVVLAPLQIYLEDLERQDMDD